tara:strand:- start:30 stop:650 length:621 start_codon:yes stop_codon:yes gene_type:complete
MELLTPKNIKSYFAAKQYRFFDTPDKKLNLNIIGVRRDNQGSNTFDDFLLVMYREEEMMVSHRWQVTTDPGKYWLINPMNPKGTAVLVPGQYSGTYKLGKHQNNYEALVQAKPVKVWRDNTKDDIIDYNNITTLVDKGYFGINIHRSNPYTESYAVNKWSAGCQVFKKVDDFNNFMELCRNSAKIYGPRFTYTLIDEKDLRKHLNS